MDKPHHAETVKKKYVLLFLHMITERDVQRFGCDTFLRRGYDVNLVCCWDTLYVNSLKTFEIGDFRNAPGVFKPQSREELEQFIDTLSPIDLILMTVPLSVGSFWIFQALDKRGLRYSCISLGAIPETFLCKKGTLLNLFKCLRMKALEAYGFVRRLVAKIRLMSAIGVPYLRLKAPLIFMRAGANRLAFSFPAPFISLSHVIYVEGFECVWAKSSKGDVTPFIDGPYVVFLEGGIGNQPDAKILNLNPVDNIDLYFSDLQRTLSKVEKDTGLPVIIALHPKSSYSESEQRNFFGDRLAIKGESAALVKNAELVLAHYSTSISFAVIYRKPIIFLSNETFRNYQDGYYIYIFASWFDQEVIDMGEIDLEQGEPIKIIPVSDKILDRYTHNFLCSHNAESGPIWDVLADKFESLTSNASKGRRELHK